MKLFFKKAFSLVEISIVLIVIALLISGIISGKSLITNAKINIINSELETLKIAIDNYVEDNKIADLSEINIGSLINNGYLDENAYIEYNYKYISGYDDNGNYQISSDSAIAYPSKIAGASWFMKGDIDSYELIIGSKSSKQSPTTQSVYNLLNSVGSIFDEKFCNVYVKKYSNEKANQTIFYNIDYSHNNKCNIQIIVNTL